MKFYLQASTVDQFIFKTELKTNPVVVYLLIFRKDAPDSLTFEVVYQKVYTVARSGTHEVL